MVSPIPSLPLSNQLPLSIYSTLNRYPRIRHRSGISIPRQYELDIPVSSGVTNGAKNIWRFPQAYLGVTAENTAGRYGRRASENLEMGRISLWNQKASSVEHPEPHRFGSLGRHEDHLIRKYLQRHSSIQGLKALLPESHAHSHCK